MRTYGIIGYPLSHSFSQKYFTEKFRKENISGCEFRNFPLANIDTLTAVIKDNPTLCGLSITIPHKESVVKYLDDIDPAAKKIGAVNCISVSHESSVVRLKGYNTDVFGFEQSLKPLLQPYHTDALILGTGGAAKAVAYILDKIKIKFRHASTFRKTKASFSEILSYKDITTKIISGSTLIINTTPLGMFPDTDTCPDIPYGYITPKHLLYDLVYNPEETLFIRKGKEKGAQVKNGLEMLQLQAEKAWEIWNTSTNNE